MAFTTDPIPVKPYVRQYLLHKFQCTRSGVVLIPGRDPIMILLKALLTTNPERRDRRITLDKYTTTVSIGLDNDIFVRNGFALSRTSTVVFQTFVEEKIKDKLCDWYEAAKCFSKDFELTQMMEAFIDKYDFDEENFPLDTMKKALYRYRIREEARQ